MKKYKLSSLIVFIALVSGCQSTSFNDVSTYELPVTDAEMHVLIKEDSYNPSNVKITSVGRADYSGNFQSISEIPEIKQNIDRIIKYTNLDVSQSQFRSAYAIPTVFLDGAGQRKIDNPILNENLDGNPDVILNEINEFDFNSEKEITIEDLRKDQQEYDFLHFGINGSS